MGEPSLTDPLCEVVAQAVQAGIVVAAAGAVPGLADDGSRVLGNRVARQLAARDTTAGALNTQGTAKRSDDTVVTQLARSDEIRPRGGSPTAAPGNKIISLEAMRVSGVELFAPRAGRKMNAYMQLSGTSKAAPMVSGGAALLLQGTPGMTPSQLKLALQMGATYVQDGGLMGAGAGSVNFWASRKVAATGLVGQLGVHPDRRRAPAAVPERWRSGIPARWRTGCMPAADCACSSPLQALSWLNPTLLNFGDLNLLGLTNPLASVTPKFLLYGEAAGWTGSQSDPG